MGELDVARPMRPWPCSLYAANEFPRRELVHSVMFWYLLWRPSIVARTASGCVSALGDTESPVARTRFQTWPPLREMKYHPQVRRGKRSPRLASSRGVRRVSQPRFQLDTNLNLSERHHGGTYSLEGTHFPMGTHAGVVRPLVAHPFSSRIPTCAGTCTKRGFEGSVRCSRHFGAYYPRAWSHAGDRRIILRPIRAVLFDLWFSFVPKISVGVYVIMGKNDSNSQSGEDFTLVPYSRNAVSSDDRSYETTAMVSQKRED